MKNAKSLPPEHAMIARFSRLIAMPFIYHLSFFIYPFLP